MKERYAFIFDYNGGWMILLYEDGINTKYFNSAENGWDDSLDYTDLFIGNGGTKYHYMLPSYDFIKNIDVFGLGNHPIEALRNYLLKSNTKLAAACRMCDNARLNDKLTDENDYSAITIGNCADGYRMMLCSGWGRPLRIEIEKWNEKAGWYKIGEYNPAYCPNCGRKIDEYNN